MTMSLVILQKIKSISLLERTSFKNIRLDKLHACRKRRDHGGTPPPFLADQSTLVQPGGHIMPTTLLRVPRIFRSCNGPELL